jgi:hypothetical protein
VEIAGRVVVLPVLQVTKTMLHASDHLPDGVGRASDETDAVPVVRPRTTELGAQHGIDGHVAEGERSAFTGQGDRQWCHDG